MNDRVELVSLWELTASNVLGVPVNGGMSRLVDSLGDAVTIDDLGRPAIPRTLAVELAEKRREEQARRAEEAARQFEEASKNRPVRKGVPAVEGADTGVAALQAQDDCQTPNEEFGLPKPRFLEEQLAEGRAAAAAKKKAADKLRRDLQ